MTLLVYDGNVVDVLGADDRAPEGWGSMQPGQRLGRYELLVPVAQGGMARVWAAQLQGHHGFSKLVAVKTILPHLASDPEFERMFLDEAHIASRIHHPNVCEIYELGEQARTLYLAMEWVNGDSLARLLLASGTMAALEPRIAARVLADACAGVHAAHRLEGADGEILGVVHRDLSPQNLLLTTDGVVKVADFGVAKAFGERRETSGRRELEGKLAYMSPEQLNGVALDRRSDVFALGSVLFEASTGRRPFQGDGEAEHLVIASILRGTYPAPRTLVPDYPPELEAIVHQALAPDPTHRFSSAEAMRFALEEFLASGPLVTQSHVAHVLRERLGAKIDKRKERLRSAAAEAAERSSSADWSSGTPSGARSALPSHSQLAPIDRLSSPSLGTGSYSGPFTMPPSSGAMQVPPSHRVLGTGSYAAPPMLAPGYVAAMPSPAEPPVGRGQYLVAILGGLFCAVIVGGGAFAIWRLGHRAGASSAVEAPPEAGATSVATAVPRTDPVVATPVAPTASSAAPTTRVEPARPRPRVEPKLPANPY